MPIDFSGTNTEEIDKLSVSTIEFRTTLRICLAFVGIGFPLTVGLLTFLVAQSFSTSAKVDRLSDQMATVRYDFVRLAERQERLERSTRP